MCLIVPIVTRETRGDETNVPLKISYLYPYVKKLELKTNIRKSFDVCHCKTKALGKLLRSCSASISYLSKRIITCSVGVLNLFGGCFAQLGLSGQGEAELTSMHILFDHASATAVAATLSLLFFFSRLTSHLQPTKCQS